MKKITVIDSHTGGEPTRIVVAGGPELGGGSLAERREKFQRESDRFRSAVVNEPRGSDVVVGALLCEPVDKSCVTGVIFFNNVGYLGMCGHGTIGLMVTLAHLGRIKPGEHKIETPVGIITATLHTNGEVSVANVPSWREKKDVTVDVPGIGQVTGDVAWGGNWFFLVERTWAGFDPGECGSTERLRLARASGRERAGFSRRGSCGAVWCADRGRRVFKNFVLCPGKAYDRSPCGTGTSAKLACLAADGKLCRGEMWVQESIIGSTFIGTFHGWIRQRARLFPSSPARRLLTPSPR